MSLADSARIAFYCRTFRDWRSPLAHAPAIASAPVCKKKSARKGVLVDLKDAAVELGIPPRRLREFVNEGRIAFVRTGVKQVKFTKDQIERFVRDNEEPATCQGATQDRDSAFSKSDNAFTSSGQKAVAAASAQRAQAIAQKLKSRSANSSAPASGKMARVIPLRRS